MAKKVIIDCDPGIDDAAALAMALFDPRFEVLAVTAVAGNVDAKQASRNVQSVIEQLDPPRWPRVGVASDPDSPSPVDARHIHGDDGLANIGFAVAELHNRHAADKVICDTIRDNPEEVTIIALGPLTNIARALTRDADFASLVGRLIIMGGAVTAPGNVTPAAEFNIYCDPVAAQTVFRSRTTKTLVPLDVTSKLVMTYDQLDQLPRAEEGRAKFLRDILTFAFRTHREQQGLEGIHLHDAVAIVAALHPELFHAEEMAGDVETEGELTRGVTVFDRRQRKDWRDNMEVTTDVDVAAAMDCILRGLAHAVI